MTHDMLAAHLEGHSWRQADYSDIWVASACSLPLGPIFGFPAAGSKEKHGFQQGANMSDIRGAGARAPEYGRWNLDR